ncbi:hypothetical protein E2C01_005475 [Portunus trituberculatus]|uniref:Uncharacterized protein n=1 Tax=Portunus trituberculatus TaxID=210409 RepID=A0A5B7CUH6_PORTR|nr:hypothetical protein [Portunus trituberculatus]
MKHCRALNQTRLPSLPRPPRCSMRNGNDFLLVCAPSVSRFQCVIRQYQSVRRGGVESYQLGKRPMFSQMGRKGITTVMIIRINMYTWDTR